MKALRLAFGALVVVLLSVGNLAAEEIYRWRDAQGTIHFADAPPTYPAEVSRLDGAGGRTAARTTQASPTAPRVLPATVNPSIISLINERPRSPSRRTTNGTPSGKRSAASPATAGSGSLSGNAGTVRLNISGKVDAGTGRDPTADDLSVPSLDRALTAPVSNGDGSERPAAPSRRQSSQSGRLMVDAENP